MPRRMGLTETQTAMKTLLENGLSYVVLDYVPEKRKYPFIVIGEDESNESYLQDKTNDARTMNCEITIWSKKHGYKEVNEISQEILALIPNISISNFAVIDYSYSSRKIKSAKVRRLIMDIDFDLDQIS